MAARKRTEMAWDTQGMRLPCAYGKIRRVVISSRNEYEVDAKREGLQPGLTPAQLAAWVSWYAGSLDNIPG
jgi:hypothetical protein